jgi:hypothetical protein
MANEKPNMVRDENSFLHSSSPEVENDPKFVGKPTEIHLRTREGMPKHIHHDEIAALFRVIHTNKTIVWTPPLQACKSIAITLTDRQQLQDDDDRYVRVILRAMPYFHGKPSHDNVKVAVAYDTGDKIHFAKCVVFLQYGGIFRSFAMVRPGRSTTVGLCVGFSATGIAASQRHKQLQFYAHHQYCKWCNYNLFRKKIWVLLSQRETFAYELTNTKKILLINTI